MTTLPGLDDLCRAMRPPVENSGLRVLVLEVGDLDVYGAGRLQMNPWLSSKDLPLRWPLSDADVEDLVSRGLGLSVWDVLQKTPSSAAGAAAVLGAAREVLRELVGRSQACCDQLLARTQLPLVFRHHALDKKATATLENVERVLKQRLAEVQHSGNLRQDWTRSAASYEVWLVRSPGDAPLKVRVRGGGRAGSAYDLNGSLLTGGRVWAGSLLMMRWLAAISACSCESNVDVAPCIPPTTSIVLGGGPVLELGSGVGIVGITLAKLGRRVVMSDREPVLIEQINSNIDDNGVRDNCRVLELEWASAASPKMRKLLAAQRFTAVVGADVVYEDVTAHLIVGVLRSSLPHGGVGIFANGLKYRRGIDAFGPALVDAGFVVMETRVKVDEWFQTYVCGEFEQQQEYSMCVVRVPPQAVGPSAQVKAEAEA